MHNFIIGPHYLVRGGGGFSSRRTTQHNNIVYYYKFIVFDPGRSRAGDGTRADVNCGDSETNYSSHVYV